MSRNFRNVVAALIGNHCPPHRRAVSGHASGGNIHTRLPSWLFRTILADAVILIPLLALPLF